MDRAREAPSSIRFENKEQQWEKARGAVENLIRTPIYKNVGFTSEIEQQAFLKSAMSGVWTGEQGERRSQLLSALAHFEKNLRDACVQLAATDQERAANYIVDLFKTCLTSTEFETPFVLPKGASQEYRTLIDWRNDEYEHGVTSQFTYRTEIGKSLVASLEECGPYAAEAASACFRVVTSAFGTERMRYIDTEEDEVRDEDILSTRQEDEIEVRDHDFDATEFSPVFKKVFDILKKESHPLTPNATTDLVNAVTSNVYVAHSYGYETGALLNRTPAVSGEILLKCIRETENETQSLLLKRLLYRLELGKIGLTGNTVEYLGKKFDVAGAEGAVFAHRLTGDGAVGLFDKNKNALKYFHLTELDQPEKVTKAKLLDFTLDTLFYPKPDETPEERAEREQILEEFKAAYFETYLSGAFYKHTNVQFNNLSLREQGWFLWYVQHASVEEKKRAMDFIKQYREDGFKTFLSMELDSTAGKNILEIGEKFPSKEAAKLFKDYTGIIIFADDFAAAIFPKLKKSAPEADEKVFNQKIRQRATKFLEYCAHTIQADPALTYDQVLQKLQKERPGLSMSNCTEGVVSGAIIELVNEVGDVEARAILEEVSRETQNPVVRRAVESSYAMVTPIPRDAVAHTDLRTLYDSIHFETYAVNEKVNDRELAALHSKLELDDAILDLGCGTGRLLLPLAAEGYAVTGLDFTTRHIELIHKKNPSVEAVHGTWLATSFADKSFDAVYSLGRNILHETVIQNQQQLFLEANRVLTVGGKFIFDVPDRTKGGYAELIRGYKEVMRQRDIHRVRSGTIYDSPDGKNFATRYVYSHEDIIRLAEDAGFVIEEVNSTPLPTGKGDENMYYTLRKVSDAKAEAAFADLRRAA